MKAFQNAHVQPLFMLLAGLISLISCNNGASHSSEVVEQNTVLREDSAHWVLKNALAYYGGGKDSTRLAFDFRKIHYTMKKNGGHYEYTRRFTSKTGDSIVDVLTNTGFMRLVNERVTALSERDEKAFSNSLNSVIYFVMLPFKLQDDAVILKYDGIRAAFGERFYCLDVRFKEEGGGEDHDDVFYYWFNTSTFQMTYLAYKYNTEGERGVRFRKATKMHKTASGMMLQDYTNYKSDSISIDLKDALRLFEDGKLDKLSVIALENVKSD